MSHARALFARTPEFAPRVRWVEHGRARGWLCEPAPGHSPCVVCPSLNGVRIRRRSRNSEPTPIARFSMHSEGSSVTLVDSRSMAHTTRFALESTRIRAIHPAVCAVNGRWFAAWLREDLGRVSIEVATLHKGRVERRRVAEVWTSLDPVELALAAPQIASRPNGGVWLAWRESRGNLPAIYLRALDPLGRHDGPEHRLSTRGVAAANTRFALASNHRGGWACLFAEPRENLQTVCLAWG